MLINFEVCLSKLIKFRNTHGKGELVERMLEYRGGLAVQSVAAVPTASSLPSPGLGEHGPALLTGVTVWNRSSRRHW